MDFTQFVPRETHRALQWLGKHRWLETSVAQDGAIVFKWRFPEKDKSIAASDYEFVQSIEDTCAGSGNDRVTSSDRLLGLFYRAASAALVNGPKMFMPTPIQCEALENVDVDVPFEDYRQPYETLIVALPLEYRRAAMERHNLSEFPVFALVHHDLGSNIITVASNYNQRAAGETVVAVLRPTRPGMNIEEEFRKEELKNEPLVDRIIQRLAVNICLLMTHYRIRTRPMDPKQREKLQAQARKQDADKAERARTLLVGQMTVVEFEQNIQFHDVEEDVPAEGEIVEGRPHDGGYTVRPHWRRGHWRRQQHGQRFAEKVKSGLIQDVVLTDDSHHRVFIKPILVKKDAFSGEKSQTKVTYTGDKRDMHRPPDKPRPT
jgi:hypothetical protein